MMDDIDHIFLTEYAHTHNEIKPFYDCLNRRNKHLFTNIDTVKTGGLTEFRQYQPQHTKAIAYVSSTKLATSLGLQSKYVDLKIVRMYHGIVMPWAKAVDPLQQMDIAICASSLDESVWKLYNPKQRIAVIGWPKGEAALASNDPPIENICVNSNWSIEKSAFDICDRLSELKNYRVTLTLHPLLEERATSPRRVNQSYFMDCLLKLGSHVEVKSCSNGVLEHFHNQSVLLGVMSSSSIEWLLYNRPILFLKNHHWLNFGPLITDEHLAQQIERERNNKFYVERRQLLRRKLLSHCDGLWQKRFHDLVSELEEEIK